MGSAPNAAAPATVRHPVQQGLLQSLGVFVDTILVCSATAFIILMAGPSVYTPGVTGEEQGAALTQVAVAESLGSWTTIPMTVLIFVFAYSSILGKFTYAECNVAFLSSRRWAPIALRALVTLAVLVGSLAQLAAADSLGEWVTLPMTVLIFVFAFSSILGNFTYAEVNVDFLSSRRWASLALRTLVTLAVLVGALAELALVWTVADIAMGLMAIVNLVAIVLLGRWAIGALRDYEQYRGRELGAFLGRGNPLLPGDLPGDIWVSREVTPSSERVG